jgi:hypothetical protein
LTFPEESHFIPLFYKAYGDPRSARQARRLVARIFKLRWMRSWGLPIDPASFADCRSFREIVCRIFEAWARYENKPRWGDKTPHYFSDIPVLLDLFPDAKIIHIYRDGRDVALSWMRTSFPPSNLFVAARAWKTLVCQARRDGASLPPQTYLGVCYETLLERPLETMQMICAFLDEPFDPAVLRPNRLPVAHRHPDMVGKPASETDILPSNVAKWKTAMTLAQRALFESVAGGLLVELGYPTEGLARPIPRPEQWRWQLHHAFRWLIERFKGLPDPDSRTTFIQLNWAALRARFRGCTRPLAL